MDVFVSDASSFDVYFRPLRRASGLEIIVDPSIESMSIRAPQGPSTFGEAIDDICQRYGVAWRWRDSATLVFGTTEALGHPGFRSP